MKILTLKYVLVGFLSAAIVTWAVMGFWENKNNQPTEEIGKGHYYTVGS